MTADWRVCTFSPLDVLVAADSRPLDDGDWGYEGQLFPQAFAGAIRTHILRSLRFPFKNGKIDCVALNLQQREVADKLGIDDPAQMRAQFAGPLLWDGTWRQSLLLPAPRTRLVQEDSVFDLTPSVAATGQRSAGEVTRNLTCVSSDVRDARPTAQAWSIEHVCHYLGRAAETAFPAHWTAASLQEDAPQSISELVQRERRFGHRRNARETTEEHALFSRSVVRLREDATGISPGSFSYAMLARGIDAELPVNHQATVRLGGDSRLALLDVLDSTAHLSCVSRLRRLLTAALPTLRGLLLYLASPGIFELGWRPKTNVSGLDLVAAAVDRPATVAGWDLRIGKPKPVRRAAPAGSVYFFQMGPTVELEQVWKFIDRFHWNESVSEFDDKNLGYGLALFGLWDSSKVSAPGPSGVAV